MTDEVIYNGSIGASVSYGKNSAGVLKALRTNDDGETVGSVPTYLSATRKTMAAAAQEVTITATARIAHIFAEGGDIRVALNADATATSPIYIPAGSVAVVYLTGATKLSVYGPTGAYANAVQYT